MNNPHQASERAEYKAGIANLIIIADQHIDAAAGCTVCLDQINPKLKQRMIASIDRPFAEIKQAYPAIRA